MPDFMLREKIVNSKDHKQSCAYLQQHNQFYLFGPNMEIFHLFHKGTSILQVIMKLYCYLFDKNCNTSYPMLNQFFFLLSKLLTNFPNHPEP